MAESLLDEGKKSLGSLIQNGKEKLESVKISVNSFAGVTTPDFQLELLAEQNKEGGQEEKGKDLTPSFASRLISLSLTDNRGFVADKLDITLDDSDGKIELPERGKKLKFSLGRKGKPLADKGLFVVDTIQHSGAPDRVKIIASSADLAGTFNAANSYSWHDVTLGHIVETIAKKHAFTPKIDNEFREIKVHIDQAGESDAAFLTRLATRNGAEVSVKFGELRFFKPGRAKTPVVEITRAAGDTHQFTIADRPNFTGVAAEWLETKDPSQKNQNVALLRKSNPQQQQAPQHPNATTPSQPTKGAANEYMAGKKGNVMLLRTLYADEDQAHKAAEAAWTRYQKEAATFNLTLAAGRESLEPDTQVTVQGFKKTIDDHSWIIKTLTHTINESGFTTRLELEVGIADATYYIQQESKNANQLANASLNVMMALSSTRGK